MGLDRTGPARAGRGTVIGVIGGYERGGYLESVSYSPRFGHGRGLFLVQSLADEWGYLQDSGGTTVWFRLTA